jgi:4-carboxymuconolactone decarboxylase
MWRITAWLLSAVCLATPGIGAERDETGALPADIDPVSLSRLPVVTRDTLDADGQRVYDMVVGRDRTTPLLGPGGISLHSPKVAEAMNLLNTYLRSNGVLGPRYTEVAILVAAWEIEQQYEWSAHEPAARRFGVPDAVIDAIKYDRGVEGLSAEESLIVRFSRQLLREHSLPSELYAEAVRRFGQQGTFELTAVIGDYVMAGIMLNAADQRQPPDRPALLPGR